MDNINELNSLNYAIENMDSPRGTHIESEKQKFNEKWNLKNRLQNYEDMRKYQEKATSQGLIRIKQPAKGWKERLKNGKK